MNRIVLQLFSCMAVLVGIAFWPATAEVNERPPKRPILPMTTFNPKGCAATSCPTGTSCVEDSTGQARCCDTMCTKIYAPVCGSDGKTYGNQCELDASACQTNSGTTKAYDGDCQTVRKLPEQHSYKNNDDNNNKTKRDHPTGLHMQDLESSLYYSLWVEIPSRVSFDNESLTALKKYINVLAKYHPGTVRLRRFLNELNDWLAAQCPPLTVIAWLQKLNSTQSRDAYIGTSLRWIGCRGSDPSLRGYPCSLWMTFHAITVNAYVKEIANMSFDAHDVLVPIADYIRHFFSCRECAANFGRRAPDLPSLPLEPRDVVLWFWKSHNRANLQLHGDSTEDPRHPKVQFPSYEACPSCRVEAAAGLRFNISEDAWREDKVLTYLLRFYGKDHIFDDEDDIEETSARRTHHPHGGSTCANVRCRSGSTCDDSTGQAKCVCNTKCTKIYAPVCGSDGKTYGNQCELDVTACQNNSGTTKAYDGECQKGRKKKPVLRGGGRV